MGQYAIILSVNPDKWSPEEEICKHFRHLVKNGTVEWGSRSIRNKKIHEQNKRQTPFYAYAFIPKKGIKYRFSVEKFKTNAEGQKTIPPFDYKNVPEHYFVNENKPTDKSWLKITRIEKINPSLNVTNFKNFDGNPVKATYIRKPIYVLDMPLKTSILTESDCPLDEGEVTTNPEKEGVYIKSRQRLSKIPIENRNELRRSPIGGMGAERERDEETIELIAERTDAHQEILMIFFDLYNERGMQVFRSINYDLLVEKEDIALLHEMKTLTEENERDQIMKGIGQLFYYEHFTLQQDLENHNAQVVKAIVFQKSPTYSPHIEFIKSLGIHVFWIGDDSRIVGEAESMAFLRAFLGMG